MVHACSTPETRLIGVDNYSQGGLYAPSAWTSEALWSGGKYVRLGVGGEMSVSINVECAGRYRVFMVYDKQPGTVAINVSVPVLRIRSAAIRLACLHCALLPCWKRASASHATK